MSWKGCLSFICSRVHSPKEFSLGMIFSRQSITIAGVCRRANELAETRPGLHKELPRRGLQSSISQWVVSVSTFSFHSCKMPQSNPSASNVPSVTSTPAARPVRDTTNQKVWMSDIEVYLFYEKEIDCWVINRYYQNSACLHHPVPTLPQTHGLVLILISSWCR